MVRRLRLPLLLAALAALLWLWLAGSERPPAPPTAGRESALPAPAAGPAEGRVDGSSRPEDRTGPARRHAGLAPRVAAPEVVAAAHRHLDAAMRQERCGPYELRTDVVEGRVLELCRRIGSELDAVYRRRYGLEPLGEPAGTVLLFSSAAAFRLFADEVAGLRAGYAGFSDAARGFVAMHVEDEPLAETASTLAHELAHLVHRRALGADLPPWLSEGLADGIGDAATPDGLGPLEGRRGAEALAARLAGGYELGRTRPLQELAALSRSQFDRGTVSFDYEQSALLVRYLLADAELAPRFRGLLRQLAQGEPYAPELVRAALGISWQDLDRDFERWVRG